MDKTAAEFDSARITIGTIETAQQRAVQYLTGILESLEANPGIEPILPPVGMTAIFEYPGMTLDQTLSTMSLELAAAGQDVGGDEGDFLNIGAYVFAIASIFF